MQTSILLKPLIASIRYIMLDSGSYIDFEALDILEKELDLLMSIREHFDIANRRGINAWVIFEKLYKGEEFLKDY
jgi:hypothetical protein